MGRPEAACCRPRRDSGGDGHIESLPGAGFVIWIWPLPLVQGLQSATGNLGPLWGPGGAGCFGTRLEVLGSDGLCRWWGRQAPPLRLPDLACRLG